MMLERRIKHGVLRLIQPKDRSCVTGGEKPSVTDKIENGPVAANGNEDDDHEGKAQHEKTDETSNVSSHAVGAKSGPVNVSAVPGKLTYNPITHAPSMFELICPDSTKAGYPTSVLFHYSSKYIWHFNMLCSDSPLT